MKLKRFTCNIITQCPDYALELAITLPGWSHAHSDGWSKIHVSWYPFDYHQRRIYFNSKNRTAAAKQCVRAGLQIRDLTEV